jgi:hypothetical protein
MCTNFPWTGVASDTSDLVDGMMERADPKDLLNLVQFIVNRWVAVSCDKNDAVDWVLESRFPLRHEFACEMDTVVA